VLFPLSTTQRVGGQNLRVEVLLAEEQDRPVEGASVRVELWSPADALHATSVCTDKGAGHYLSEVLHLPWRGVEGNWRVVVKASWEGGGQAETQGTFSGSPSISEQYQDRYGFWVDPPTFFCYNVSFYNLHECGGLHFEDHAYPDGGGYVFLDNYRYVTNGSTFTELDVHWQKAPFLGDEAAAMAYVKALAGIHRQDRESPLKDLNAQAATFQGRPAWQVSAQWKEILAPIPHARLPAEWMVFQCPGSDWLWTLVISTDDTSRMDDLRELRETFECP
jgi:hypothetical protein